MGLPRFELRSLPPQGRILDQAILQPRSIIIQNPKLIKMVYETVVGRMRDDLEKFGTTATGFIGKHIVGTGEDAHLTTRVLIDLLKPHVILVCGKRGSGKSYSVGTILEELLSLELPFGGKVAAIVFDPVGIYWSMKLPNDQQKVLLKEWELDSKGFPNLKIFVPAELKEEYEKSGIPVDYALSLSPREFSPDDWTLAFNLERTSEFAVTLEKNLSELLASDEAFTLDDIETKIRDDPSASQHVKNVLTSFLDVAKSWGIFSMQGMSIQEIVKPNQVSVIDFSRLRGEEWGVRNLLAAWITRRVYQERVISRKEEELAKVEGREPPKKIFPITWLVIEEAHNFVPSDRKTASTDTILNIAKQGREPGVSLVVVTQMPNKVHQDILSQTDIVVSFRLTSRDDLQALHAVYQTYMAEDLEKMINNLPRWLGSAIILDDNLEKVFTINIRPRLSHHAGGTAAAV